MLVTWVVCLTLILRGSCLGQSSASSVSYSVPGYAPVTYTQTSGLGFATATSASPSPVYYRPAPQYHRVIRSAEDVKPLKDLRTVEYVPQDQQFLHEPLIRNKRQGRRRNDVTQQVFQREVPAGLFAGTPAPPSPVPVRSAPGGISQSTSPVSFSRSVRNAGYYSYTPSAYRARAYYPSQYYRSFAFAPPVYSFAHPLGSFPGALAQAGAAFAPPAAQFVPAIAPGAVAYSPPAPSAGSFSGALAQAAAAFAPPPPSFVVAAPPPAPVATYGLPVQGGNFAGADAQAAAAAPPSPPPAEYGPPAGNFAGADAQAVAAAPPSAEYGLPEIQNTDVTPDTVAAPEIQSNDDEDKAMPSSTEETSTAADAEAESQNP